MVFRVVCAKTSRDSRVPTEIERFHGTITEMIASCPLSLSPGARDSPRRTRRRCPPRRKNADDGDALAMALLRDEPEAMPRRRLHRRANEWPANGRLIRDGPSSLCHDKRAETLVTRKSDFDTSRFDARRARLPRCPIPLPVSGWRRVSIGPKSSRDDAFLSWKGRERTASSILSEERNGSSG